MKERKEKKDIKFEVSPAIFSIDEICEQIEDWAFTTDSALSYFDGRNCISYKKLRKLILTEPLIQNKYNFAKTLRAHSQLDAYEDLMLKLSREEIPSDVARVLKDMMQWKMSALDRDNFGAKAGENNTQANTVNVITGMVVK